MTNSQKTDQSEHDLYLFGRAALTLDKSMSQMKQKNRHLHHLQRNNNFTSNRWMMDGCLKCQEKVNISVATNYMIASLTSLMTENNTCEQQL